MKAKKKPKSQTKSQPQPVLAVPAVSNNNKYLALSFALPFAILGTIFAVNGIFPFGNRQILVFDLYNNYYPFLSGFWHKLREGAISPWSWTAGMGHDNASSLVNFLNPLYLLTVIAPYAGLREALTASLLVRIGCAGLFTAMYLRYACKQYLPLDGKAGGAWSLALPVFSSLYALCAFTLGYYHNIEWFDSFTLLPLVMLGLLALMREGKFKLYIVSLAFAVLMSFYIGYIICVFVVITFLGQCVVQKLSLPDFLRKLRLIAACSALAAALTAVSTIPAWFALQKVYSVRASSPTMTLYTSFINILGNFIAFTPPTIKEGLPNLYCGMISVLLAGLFIQSKKIPLREKIVSIIIFVFLLLSTNIDILNIMMHGFTRPNGYPSRFSFLISFVLVVMAYRAFLLTEDTGRWGLPAIGAGAVLILLCAVFGSQGRNYIIGSAVLCAIYIALFYFALRQKDSKRRYIRQIIFIVILTELSITSYIGIKTTGTSERDEYPNRYEQIQALLGQRRPPGNNFYRTDVNIPNNDNAPYLYNYNGVSFFSAATNPDVVNFMQGFGLLSDRVTNNNFKYIETSPLTDAFLNVRYMISRRVDPEDKNVFWYRRDDADKNVYWKTVGKEGGMLLLENNYYLPLGFMVNRGLAGYKRHVNPFVSQNNFFRLATGLDDNLFAISNISALAENDNEQTTWNYQVPLAGMAYVCCMIPELGIRRLMGIFLNGTGLSLLYITNNAPYIFPVAMSSLEQGDTLTFSLKIDEASMPLMYVGHLNGELFEQGYAKLASQPLNLTKFTNTQIRGNVTALEDGLLYTSIPADRNWSAYVDGVKSEIVPIDNAMIAVRLNKGYHEIEFRYFNKSLFVGSIVSLVSLAVFLTLAVLDTRKRRSRET